MPESIALDALMYLLVPLWLAAGLADWWFHRRSGIEHTAGIKESLIHVLMFAEVGLPMLAALFLDINAALIAFMVLMFFVHEATALWDVSYAVSKRDVVPWEQHVHSFLEMIPLMAIVLIAVLHGDQVMALVGGDAPAGAWMPTLKHEPLPTRYVVVLFCAIAVFTVLPYLNELWRCMKARRGRHTT